jgi:hypothetical protein
VSAFRAVRTQSSSRNVGGRFIGISFEGTNEVHAMLARFMEPMLTKRAQRATRKGALALAKPLRAAVTPLSKRMGRSVYVHIAKRDRPAYVVGHHRKVAFFWHMVIGGTRAHSLRPRKRSKQVANFLSGKTSPEVRGVPAHPVVERIADQYGDQAYRAMVDDLMKET